jgi:hypothetical protein
MERLPDGSSGRATEDTGLPAVILYRVSVLVKMRKHTNGTTGLLN